MPGEPPDARAGLRRPNHAHATPRLDKSFPPARRTAGLATVLAAFSFAPGILAQVMEIPNVHDATIESFETFTPGNHTAPFSILNGTAQLSLDSGTATVARPPGVVFDLRFSSVNSNGLGARPAQGDQLLGVQVGLISLFVPGTARQFGGAFAAASSGYLWDTYGDFGRAAFLMVSFFDETGAQIGQTEDYDSGVRRDGGLDWHSWQTSVPFQRVTIYGYQRYDLFPGDYPVALALDYLKISQSPYAVPEPAESAAAVAASLLGLALWRRARGSTPRPAAPWSAARRKKPRHAPRRRLHARIMVRREFLQAQRRFRLVPQTHARRLESVRQPIQRRREESPRHAACTAGSLRAQRRRQLLPGPRHPALRRLNPGPKTGGRVYR